jgi:NAD(P)-dependent dehydrogenase (short-subunit alcohol dehydrogenase family)
MVREVIMEQVVEIQGTEPILGGTALHDTSFARGTVLVVGGSGALGQAICRGFAKAGSPVALTYNKNKSAAEAVAADIENTGRKCSARQLDLARSASTAQVVEEAESTFGRIHTLVYASGPFMEFGKIADTDPAEWKRVVDADIVGYFNLVHAAIPALRRSRGSIVALTSAGTRRYPPGDILSAGAKASVEMLTRAIAREEGRHGVRANCIGVGWIDAGLGRSILSKPGVSELMTRFLRGTPLGRLGTAEDVAAVAVFLASDAASYVSGNLICVDGAGHV